ncbi:MAG: phosphate ABC transporter permease PstA [Acidobacteriota bacterium]
MRPKTAEKIGFSALFLGTCLVIVPVVIVLVVIVKKGAGAVSWEFLSAAPLDGMRAGGIFPAILGTLILVSGAVSIALPIGVLAAVYLNEYASAGRLTRIIRLAIINLAGVPSVVYGLFGLGLFVGFLGFGVSIIAGCCTLAIMELPVIITASREALNSVPQSFREVSLSLGASRWQTIRNVVLPNALPGIMTGTILSVARVAGETAPILFTVAAFYLPHLPKSIFDQTMALPYHLYIISTQIPGMPRDLTFGTALVLVTMVFLMNLAAIFVRIYFRRKKLW